MTQTKLDGALWVCPNGEVKMVASADSVTLWLGLRSGREKMKWGMRGELEKEVEAWVRLK